MAAESRPVPSALLSWFDIKDLVPDHKLFAAYLWFNRFTNACGCYDIPLGMVEVELSMKESALLEAIYDFKKKGILDYDEKTGEVYVERWLGFHKFSNAVQRSMYWSAVGKIASDRLCCKVIEKSRQKGLEPPHEKSNHYVPTLTGTVTATATKTKPNSRGAIPEAALSRIRELG